MITLDNQTKAIIIAALVVLFAVPKPSMETIKGWLVKLKPKSSGTSSASWPSLLVAGVSIFFLLSDNPTPAPSPNPDIIEVADRLDKCSADYRDLLSEVWKNYASEYSKMKNDEERLAYLNNAQSAAYTAAYDAYIIDAKLAAKDPATATSISQKLKDRKF